MKQNYLIKVSINVRKYRKRLKLDGLLEAYKYINELIYDGLISEQLNKSKKKYFNFDDSNRF